MKLNDGNIERIRGRVEVIDYILSMFCRSELPETVALKLRNIRYKYKLQIEEYERDRSVADEVQDRG